MIRLLLLFIVFMPQSFSAQDILPVRSITAMKQAATSYYKKVAVQGGYVCKENQGGPLICVQRHMNPIEASTQACNTRFIGPICVVARGAARWSAGCAGRSFAVCFRWSSNSSTFTAFAHLATALGRCVDSHLHCLKHALGCATNSNFAEI